MDPAESQFKIPIDDAFSKDICYCGPIQPAGREFLFRVVTIWAYNDTSRVIILWEPIIGGAFLIRTYVLRMILNDW